MTARNLSLGEGTAHQSEGDGSSTGLRLPDSKRHAVPSPKLRIIPFTIKQANSLVGEWHRHHKPARGGRWALGAGRCGRGQGHRRCYCRPASSSPNRAIYGCRSDPMCNRRLPERLLEAVRGCSSSCGRDGIRLDSDFHPRQRIRGFSARCRLDGSHYDARRRMESPGAQRAARGSTTRTQAEILSDSPGGMVGTSRELTSF